MISSVGSISVSIGDLLFSLLLMNFDHYTEPCLIKMINRCEYATSRVDQSDLKRYCFIQMP